MFVKVANILNLYPMVHSGTFHAYGFAPFSRGEKRLFSRVFGRFVNDPMSHSRAYRCRVSTVILRFSVHFSLSLVYYIRILCQESIS